MSTFVGTVDKNYIPNPDDNLRDSLFKQYEKVIIESIITSFGLDLLIKDQHGGDVDTILNVRKIGNDPEMTYKNKSNEKAYENRGDYNSYEYHSHPLYVQKNKEVSQQKSEGNLKDAYTGKLINKNEKSDLDHTISAKEIHNDAGRVLSGLNGADLANSQDNLNATNPHTNRTKKADSMEMFLDKYGDEYSNEEKERMCALDKKARTNYENKLAKAYYTSPKFWGDTAKAAGKTAGLLGARQVLGFIFTEMWFSVKQSLANVAQPYDLGEVLYSIGSAIKKGFENAKAKYKELIDKFLSGAISGAISSLTTTLINTFLTTAKSAVRIIRQTYASLVEAAKVLFLNPDNYPLGERMRATAKILATGASVVVGTMVNEAIDKTPVGKIPVLGEIISTFCGSFVTGIMTCTLLNFMDRSKLVNKLVSFLNNISKNEIVEYYKTQADIFEKYAAELMKIDIEKFRKEVNIYNNLSDMLSSVTTDKELNIILKNVYKELEIKLPWQGDFNDFMSDKKNRLVFE